MCDFAHLLKTSFARSVDRDLQINEFIFGVLESDDVLVAADADGGGAWLRGTDGVLAKDQVVVVAADEDSEAGVLGSVVQDAIALEDIAMSAHGLGFFAEKDAGLGIAGDFVSAEQVVGIFVPDTHSGAFVAANFIVLE